MTELPWMNSREIEDDNEYGDFECSIDDCKCLFSNKLDTFLHLRYGRHGRIGDRFSDEERIKWKYSSRQGRVKEDIYRRQNKEAENRRL
jgi:hypothetical protein